MSVLARNRHPTGRGGKMLEETSREYSFFAPVCGNNICTLSHGVVFHNPIMKETTTRADYERDDDPCSIYFGSSLMCTDSRRPCWW
jgi:hypothetical protein